MGYTLVENRYSMMARHHESLFPILEELGVGFVAFSPMANGFLAGKYSKGMTFDKRYDYRAAMPQFVENAGAVEVDLTEEEIVKLETALDNMEMSDVFGGVKNQKK